MERDLRHRWELQPKGPPAIFLPPCARTAQKVSQKVIFGLLKKASENALPTDS
jgi:hypothetical protein